jgi:hypothetical protein
MKPYDAEEVRQDLRALRTVADGLTRERDAIYLLLVAVYRAGRQWRHNVSAALARRILTEDKMIRVDRRATRNVFRFLVEFTCQKMDVKLRSRYSNALGFAHLSNCEPANLRAFMKSNGGIEQCAKKYLRHRRNSLQANNSHQAELKPRRGHN